MCDSLLAMGGTPARFPSTSMCYPRGAWSMPTSACGILLPHCCHIGSPAADCQASPYLASAARLWFRLVSRPAGRVECMLHLENSRARQGGWETGRWGKRREYR